MFEITCPAINLDEVVGLTMILLSRPFSLLEVNDWATNMMKEMVTYAKSPDSMKSNVVILLACTSMGVPIMMGNDTEVISRLRLWRRGRSDDR